MSRDDALQIVLDLIQATRNLERHNDKYNREDYEESRERVINALVSPSDVGGSTKP